MIASVFLCQNIYQSGPHPTELESDFFVYQKL